MKFQDSIVRFSILATALLLLISSAAPRAAAGSAVEVDISVLDALTPTAQPSPKAVKPVLTPPAVAKAVAAPAPIPAPIPVPPPAAQKPAPTPMPVAANSKPGPMPTYPDGVQQFPIRSKIRTESLDPGLDMTAQAPLPPRPAPKAAPPPQQPQPVVARVAPAPVPPPPAPVIAAPQPEQKPTATVRIVAKPLTPPYPERRPKAESLTAKKQDQQAYKLAEISPYSGGPDMPAVPPMPVHVEKILAPPPRPGMFSETNARKLEHEILTPDRRKMVEAIEAIADQTMNRKSAGRKAGAQNKTVSIASQPLRREQAKTDTARPSQLTLNFPVGLESLNEETVAALRDEVLPVLQSQPGQALQILGYAAPVPGKPGSAHSLSLSRALAIRSWLIDQGVEPQRLDIRALGVRADAGLESECAKLVFLDVSRI